MTTITEQQCTAEWREANGYPTRYCVTHGQDASACGQQACRTVGCTAPESADHATLPRTSGKGLLTAYAALTHQMDNHRPFGGTPAGAAHLRSLRERRDIIEAEALRRMGDQR